MERAVEREAKFEIQPDVAVPDLGGVLDGVTSGARPPVDLVATYYDSPDLRLLWHGITLRHRRDSSGLEEDLWTLKLPGATGHVAFHRSELSWSGAQATVPREARRIVRGVALGSGLEPVAGLSSHRVRLELRSADGRVLAELDDDVVRATVPPGSAVTTSFRQIELELDGGDEELLVAVSQRLEAAGARRGADEPKLQRALASRLAELGLPAVPAPDEGSTLRELVVATVSTGLERILAHDPGMRLDDDPEFVHQARVATRRLRADLRTFRPALDAGWVKRVRGELKWLGSVLGEVRDADVLGARLAELAEQGPAVDAAGYAALRERLARERAAAVGRLQEVLDSERYAALLRELDAAVAAPHLRQAGAPADVKKQSIDPSGPAIEVVPALVRSPRQGLRARARELGDDPSDTELHQVRIGAKKLRYAAEAARPVLGTPAKHVATAAEELQGVLGEHRDAVTAEAWLRAAATEPGPVSFVAGECAVAEQARQREGRERWRQAWEALEAVPDPG